MGTSEGWAGRNGGQPKPRRGPGWNFARVCLLKAHYARKAVHGLLLYRGLVGLPRGGQVVEHRLQPGAKYGFPGNAPQPLITEGTGGHMLGPRCPPATPRAAHHLPLVLLQHLMAFHSSRSRGKSRYAHPRVHQNAVHASWTSRCRLASLDADRTALQDAWRLAPSIIVHLSSPAQST